MLVRTVNIHLVTTGNLHPVVVELRQAGHGHHAFQHLPDHLSEHLLGELGVLRLQGGQFALDLLQGFGVLRVERRQLRLVGGLGCFSFFGARVREGLERRFGSGLL